jgi:hypothetical protein
LATCLGQPAGSALGRFASGALWSSLIAFKDVGMIKFPPSEKI